MTIIEIDNKINSIKIDDDSGMISIEFKDANYNSGGIIVRFWLDENAIRLFREVLKT